MQQAKNGSGRRITVKEAQVKTVQVEVKALTVSGKQVTLAVFRQLQEEELVDEFSLQLNGIPWGTVNYHWGACHSHGQHWHVVWQKGEELRRAQVNRERSYDVKEHYQKRLDHGYQAYLLHLALEGQLTPEWNQKTAAWELHHQIAGKEFCRYLRSGREDEVLKTAIRPPETHEPYRRYPQDSEESFQENLKRYEQYYDEIAKRRAQEKEQALAKLREQLTTAKYNSRNSTEARKILEKRISDSEQHARNWMTTYNNLACLDQLFIAV
jgi:hypothetical protein